MTHILSLVVLRTALNCGSGILRYDWFTIKVLFTSHVT